MKIIKKLLVLSLIPALFLTAEETKNIDNVSSNTKKTNTKKTVFFSLKHFHAAVVRAKIKPFLGKDGTVVSFKEDNMLIVRAYPEGIKRIQKIIEKIDSMKPFDSTIVKLKKASVKDIYQDIHAMSIALFPQEIDRERVSVIDSNTTNSLILVGKKENMNKLIKYIKLLDIEGGFIVKNLD